MTQSMFILIGLDSTLFISFILHAYTLYMCLSLHAYKFSIEDVLVSSFNFIRVIEVWKTSRSTNFKGYLNIEEMVA